MTNIPIPDSFSIQIPTVLDTNIIFETNLFSSRFKKHKIEGGVFPASTVIFAKIKHPSLGNGNALNLYISIK